MLPEDQAVKYAAASLAALVVVAFISPLMTLAGDTRDLLPSPPEGKTWRFAWNDEFDGDALDETKWDIPPDGRRRDAWWMRKAITLDGKGHLVIKTFRDEVGKWGGDISKAELPDQFLVDYVRVYDAVDKP